MVGSCCGGGGSPGCVYPGVAQDTSIPADEVFEGYGATVVSLDLPDDYLHTVAFTHTGESNFAVWSVDEDGESIDLLVNEIGDYQGARPLDFDVEPVALDIEADGTWQAIVQVLQRAPLWPEQTSGTGATVLVADPAETRGLTVVRLTHDGQSNVVLWAYTDDGEWDLLVNEIGEYSGEQRLPSGTVVLEIDADGDWTLQRAG